MKNKLACLVLGTATRMIFMYAISPPHAFGLGQLYIRRIDMTGKDMGAVISSSDPVSMSCIADNGRQVCFVATR